MRMPTDGLHRPRYSRKLPLEYPIITYVNTTLLPMQQVNPDPQDAVPPKLTTDCLDAETHLAIANCLWISGLDRDLLPDREGPTL